MPGCTASEFLGGTSFARRETVFAEKETAPAEKETAPAEKETAPAKQTQEQQAWHKLQLAWRGSKSELQQAFVNAKHPETADGTVELVADCFADPTAGIIPSKSRIVVGSVTSRWSGAKCDGCGERKRNSAFREQLQHSTIINVAQVS